MTWRDKPYPYTPEEIETYVKCVKKHLAAKELMTKLNLRTEDITHYPDGLPGALVNIQDLYDLLTNKIKPETLETLLAELSDQPSKREE